LERRDRRWDSTGLVAGLKKSAYQEGRRKPLTGLPIHESIAIRISLIAHQMIPVIDESGEDYLYPSSYIMAIALSKPLQQALAISPS
jgi:hypothetical protein